MKRQFIDGITAFLPVLDSGNADQNHPIDTEGLAVLEYLAASIDENKERCSAFVAELQSRPGEEDELPIVSILSALGFSTEDDNGVPLLRERGNKLTSDIMSPVTAQGSKL